MSQNWNYNLFSRHRKIVESIDKYLSIFNPKSRKIWVGYGIRKTYSGSGSATLYSKHFFYVPRQHLVFFSTKPITGVVYPGSELVDLFRSGRCQIRTRFRIQIQDWIGPFWRNYCTSDSSLKTYILVYYIEKKIISRHTWGVKKVSISLSFLNF